MYSIANLLMSDWKEKTVVICGGSSGLGLHIATELVRQGCKLVVLIGRDESKLSQAVDSLRSVALEVASKTTVQTIRGDLSNADQAANCAKTLAEMAPSVDLVVQAIGVSDRGTLASLTRERLHELIDANVVTSLHAVQHFSKALAASQGVMVLIGSLSSIFAPRFLGGYSIAKHGLAALAQQARLEYAESGMHVMLCCPGPIARDDAGKRYEQLVSSDSNLPAEALQPGGGAKIKGLNPSELARQILQAASGRKETLILPRKAWWLRLVTAFSQRLGDRILRKKSS